MMPRAVPLSRPNNGSMGPSRRSRGHAPEALGHLVSVGRTFAHHGEQTQVEHPAERLGSVPRSLPCHT